MAFIEAPTNFYLGRTYNPNTNKLGEEVVYYDSRDLTTHAVVVGMTGSGKTGLCITLLEEAILDNIPAIVIDPKGDITNLALTFPNMRPEDFAPWIHPDDARRAGMDPQTYAADMAQRWRDGLQSWGIVSERLQWLQQATKISIFTPGSEAGLPISILASLRAPRHTWAGQEEAIRERISGIVTALFALAGMNFKPVQDVEHVLLSNIIEYNWRLGRDLTLEDVIIQIKQPPFDKLGVFPMDQAITEKKRYKLAMDLNNIIAAPSFQSWLVGEPMDIQRLLYQPNGRPRMSIFYTAHLSEQERMFITTLILETLIAWMRTQAGTPSLRALLYIDEMFGYFPPYPRNPPTKEPLLRLIKQARAYGLGMILATQNPGDLDYKGLTNTGTWFIGRLQSDNDRQKVMDGLRALATAEENLNLREVEQMVADIQPRVFLMRNVHNDGGPILMHTRWAMNYLAGPLTRQQIGILMNSQRQQLFNQIANQYNAPQQGGYAQPQYGGQYGAQGAPGYGQQGQTGQWGQPQQNDPWGTQGQPPLPPAPFGNPQQGQPGQWGQPQQNDPWGTQGQPPLPPLTLGGQQQGQQGQQGQWGQPQQNDPWGQQGQPPLPPAPFGNPQQGQAGQWGQPQQNDPWGQQGQPPLPPAPFGNPQPGQQGQQSQWGQQGQNDPFATGPFGAQAAPGQTGAFNAQSGNTTRNQSLPGNFTQSKPPVQSETREYFLPVTLDSQQAFQRHAQQTGQGVPPSGQIALAYQPVLLAQAAVRFQQKTAQIYTARQFAYHIPNLEDHGLVDWEAHQAPVIDPRQVSSSSNGQALYAELPIGLTDPKRLKALEKEFVDMLYNTARMTIPHHVPFKLYGDPDRDMSEFQANVNQIAREKMQEELDKLSDRYSGLMEKLEDKLRRKERELEAERLEIRDRKREQIYTTGEAVLSIFRGRTNYTLSRMSRATRMKRQTEADLDESREVIREVEQEMVALEEEYEQKINELKDRWARVASNVGEHVITPYKKDIHLELYGVGWLPCYYVNVNGMPMLVSAFG